MGTLQGATRGLSIPLGRHLILATVTLIQLRLWIRVQGNATTTAPPLLNVGGLLGHAARDGSVHRHLLN